MTQPLLKIDFVRIHDYNYYVIKVLQKVLTGDRLMNYLYVSQTAERWGLSTRRIQILCNNKRIPGAVKIGNQWAIPSNELKPIDARIKTGKYIKNQAKIEP